MSRHEGADNMEWNTAALRQEAAEQDLEAAKLRREAAALALKREGDYWHLMEEAARSRLHREQVT